MTPTARKNPARYKLFGGKGTLSLLLTCFTDVFLAVLYHHGLTASGGHYTLDVLHPNRDNVVPPAKPREGWVRIDDELASDLRPEDVFGGSQGEGGRCAYLLFYRRVGKG
jgi:hypothetical protein